MPALSSAVEPRPPRSAIVSGPFRSAASGRKDPAYFARVEVDEELGTIVWPNGADVALLVKLKDPAVRLWYAERAAAEGWSRNVLEHQIATHLHLRQGSATTNFSATLPAADSELAREMLRDPYDLSFLPGAQIAKERDLEEALLADIVKFMPSSSSTSCSDDVYAAAGREDRFELDAHGAQQEKRVLRGWVGGLGRQHASDAGCIKAS